MNNEDAVRNEWGQICSQLKTEVGEKAFNSWLRPLSVGSFSNGIMNICVPTRFMRNWVITNYSDRIHKIWEKKNPAIKSINFVVQATEDPTIGVHNSSCRSFMKKIPNSPAPQNIYQSGADNLPFAEYTAFNESGQSLSVPLNPQYTFDNFVVGKTNEFAYAAARKVAESDNIPFNPLFLYSGVGLGKTYAYLVACILWQLQRPRPLRSPVVISTASVALQDAILQEYIPFLSRALIRNGYIGVPIRAVLRKGKERFACDNCLLQKRPCRS